MHGHRSDRRIAAAKTAQAMTRIWRTDTEQSKTNTRSIQQHNPRRTCYRSSSGTRAWRLADGKLQLGEERPMAVDPAPEGLAAEPNKQNAATAEAAGPQPASAMSPTAEIFCPAATAATSAKATATTDANPEHTTPVTEGAPTTATGNIPTSPFTPEEPPAQPRAYLVSRATIEAAADKLDKQQQQQQQHRPATVLEQQQLKGFGSSPEIKQTNQPQQQLQQSWQRDLSSSSRGSETKGVV